MPLLTRSVRSLVYRVVLALGTFSAVSVSLLASGASPARASTPSDYISEIITPAGWELHTANERCSWREVTTSVEIVTPAAWAQHSGREEPSWSGCSCSELIVPAEWSKSVGSH